MAKDIQENSGDRKRADALDKKVRERTGELHHGESLTTLEEIRRDNFIRKLKDKL